MADETSDMAVELWDDQIAGLVVSVDNQLSNQELSISTLRQLLVSALQLVRDQFALLKVSVLESSLNDSHRVVLEHEIPNAGSDDLKQLLDELLSLLQRHMGLAAQLLPQFLGAGDGIGIRLCGLALQLKCFLLEVGFARV